MEKKGEVQSTQERKGAEFWKNAQQEGATFHSNVGKQSRCPAARTELKFGLVSSQFANTVYDLFESGELESALDQLYDEYVNPDHILPDAFNGCRISRDYFENFMCWGSYWEDNTGLSGATVIEGMEHYLDDGTPANRDKAVVQALEDLKEFMKEQQQMHRIACYKAGRSCADESGNYDEYYNEEVFVFLPLLTTTDPKDRWVMFLWGYDRTL